MSPWKVIMATAVIFGTGSVTGALMIKRQDRVQGAQGYAVLPGVTNSAAPGVAFTPPGWQLQSKEFLRRMDKQLQFSPEQRQHVEKILAESQDRTKPLWEQIAPQLRDELKRVREEIRGELNPEQQKKFVRMMKLRAQAKPEAAPRRRPAATNVSGSVGTDQL